MPEPWYADGLRFTCSQCGKCCRSHGEYQFVYLTGEDIGRLSDHFGQTRREFLFEYTERDGAWRVLKWPNNEHCIFLTEQGCSVYESRPEQCRTWPFWNENLDEDVWLEEVAPFCPGVGQGRHYSLTEILELASGDGETGT